MARRDTLLMILGIILNLAVITTGCAAAPQPAYGPITFSSDYDYNAFKPINPGKEFPYGITKLYASWRYSGVTAGTLYQYEWYRDGALIESAGNSLTKTAGDTFDFYVRDPGAQKPLEPGTYKHVVKIGGQVILVGESVIRQ